jgi:carbonic anhydrase
MLCLATPVLAAETGTPHWSYEGEEGPEHWGELAPEYLMCSEGWNQSPINLVDEVKANLPELEFEYYSTNINEINNGHSIQQNIKPGSFLRVPERNQLAVVGVLVDEGEEHPVLNQLWAFMPENPGETSQKPIGIEETDLLPPTREYYSYSGSLTTPPCTEGVRWVVLKTPVQASAGQIATFKSRVGPATNRPVQPVNARMILD